MKARGPRFFRHALANVAAVLLALGAGVGAAEPAPRAARLAAPSDTSDASDKSDKSDQSDKAPALLQAYRSTTNTTARGKLLLQLARELRPGELAALTELHRAETDAGLREALLSVIAGVGRAQAGDYLVKCLRADAAGERSIAMRKLSELSVVSAVPALLDALESGPAESRRDAAVALAALTGVNAAAGAGDSARALAWRRWWELRQAGASGAQSTQGDDARRRALVAAWLSGGVQRGSATNNLLKEGAVIGPFLREAAVSATGTLRSAALRLAELAEWGIGPELLHALPDPLAATRDAAPADRLALAVRLKEKPDPVYTGVLLRFLRDPSADVREQAVEALGRLENAPARVEEDLIAMLYDGDDNTRISAIEALARRARGESDNNPFASSRRRRDGGGRAAIPRGGAEIVKLLFDRSLSVRIAACDALGDMQGGWAVKDLALALRDPDWRVRAKAVEALGATQSPEALPEIEKAMSDEDAFVKSTALTALGHLGSENTVPRLLALVRGAKSDRSVYWQALLGQREWGTNTAALVALAGDLGPEERILLVDRFSAGKETGAVRLATTMLDAASGPEQLAALNYFQSVAATGAAARIEALLRHPSNSVRRAAGGALILARPETAEATLLAGLADPDTEVRNAALWRIPALCGEQRWEIDVEATRAAAVSNNYHVRLVRDGDSYRVQHEKDGNSDNEYYPKDFLEQRHYVRDAGTHGLRLRARSPYAISSTAMIAALTAHPPADPLGRVLAQGVRKCLGAPAPSAAELLQAADAVPDPLPEWLDLHGAPPREALRVAIFRNVLLTKDPAAIAGLHPVLTNCSAEVKAYVLRLAADEEAARPLLILMATDPDASEAVQDAMANETDAESLATALVAARAGGNLEYGIRRRLEKELTVEQVPALVELLPHLAVFEVEELKVRIREKMDASTISNILERLVRDAAADDAALSSNVFAGVALSLLGAEHFKGRTNLLERIARAGDAAARTAALEKLRELAPAQAQALMLAWLESGSTNMLAVALEGLRDSKDPRYLAALERAIASEDPAQRLPAAAALLRRGDARGVRALTRLLDDETHSSEASRELSRPLSARMQKVAVAELAGLSPRARLGLANLALQSWRPGAALSDALTTALLSDGADGDEAGDFAWQMLHALPAAQQSNAVQKILAQDDAILVARVMAFLAEGRADRQQLPLLRRYLDDTRPEVAGAAATALAAARDTQSVARIAMLLSIPEARGLALQALISMGGPALLHVLPHLKDPGEDDNIGRTFSAQLESTGDAAMIPALVSFLRGEGAKSAGLVLPFLARFQDNKDVAALFRDLLQSHDATALRIVLPTLCKGDDATTLPNLLEAYAQAAPRMQALILQALAIKTPPMHALRGEVLALLQREAAAAAGPRLDALRALLLLDYEGVAEPVFREVLRSGDETNRQYALRYYAVHWTNAVFATVTNLLAQPARGVRIEAIRALGWSGQAGAADALAAAWDAADDTTRRHLMYALAHADCARLGPLLEQAVGTSPGGAGGPALSLLARGDFPGNAACIAALASDTNSALHGQALAELADLDEPAFQRLLEEQWGALNDAARETLATAVAQHTTPAQRLSLFADRKGGRGRWSSDSALYSVVSTLPEGLGDRATLDRLIPSMQEYERGLRLTPEVRMTLWPEALRDMTTERSKTWLRCLLQESTPRPEELPFLRKVLAEGDEALWPAAAAAVYRLPARDAEAVAREILQTGHADLRDDAVKYLAMLGDTQALDRLRMTDGDDEEGVVDASTCLILAAQFGREVPLAHPGSTREGAPPSLPFSYDEWDLLWATEAGRTLLRGILAEAAAEDATKVRLAGFLATQGEAAGWRELERNPETLSTLWLKRPLSTWSVDRRNAIAAAVKNEAHRMVLADILTSVTEMRERALAGNDADPFATRRGGFVALDGGSIPIDGFDESVATAEKTEEVLLDTHIQAGAAGATAGVALFENLCEVELMEWDPESVIAVASGLNGSFAPREPAGRVRDLLERYAGQTPDEARRITMDAWLDGLEDFDRMVRTLAMRKLREITLQAFPFERGAAAETRRAQVARWRTWWGGARAGNPESWFRDALMQRGYLSAANTELDEPARGRLLVAVLLREPVDSPLFAYAAKQARIARTPVIRDVLRGQSADSICPKERVERILQNVDTSAYRSYRPYHRPYRTQRMSLGDME